MTDQPGNADQTPCAKPSVTFQQVFKDELEAIDRQGKADQLVGLALSGGGIRSATFNLGVLQALAAEGLLSRFDYLSTVSGGGYIGGWLSAWIHRAVRPPDPSTGDADANKAALVVDARKRDRQALAAVSHQLDALPEPRPIAHLREFSNFLTPRRGLFSMDTLSWVTMYICNLQLSLVTVIGLFAAAILATWMALPWWARIRTIAVDHPATVILLTIGLLGLCVIVFGINFATNASRPRKDPREIEGRPASPPAFGDQKPPRGHRLVDWLRTPSGIVRAALVPAILAAGLFSVWGNWLLIDPGNATCTDVNARNPLASWLASLPGGVFGVMSIVVTAGALYMLLWAIGWQFGSRVEQSMTNQASTAPPSVGAPSVGMSDDRRLKAQKWGWMFAGAWISGAAGAFILYQATAFACRSGLLSTPSTQWVAAAFSTTVIAFVVSQVIVLHIGLVGRNFDGLEREWWARLGAWWLVLTAGWTLLFVVVLLGPPVLEWSQDWALNALSISWLVSVVGGILAGKSARSGPNGNPVLNAVSRVVPTIAVAGFVLMVTAILERLLIAWNARSMPTELLTAPTIAALVQDHIQRAGDAAQHHPWALWLVIGVALVLGWRGNINLFSLHTPYRLRLARCYLGASRDLGVRVRDEDRFVGFVSGDDVLLPDLVQRWDDEPANCQIVAQRPYPLVNTALNIVRGSQLRWQQRKAAAFFFSPLYCGFEFPRRPDDDGEPPAPGFCDARDYMAERKPIDYSTVMTLSGAAASPNMGFHSSPSMTFLMTIFNVRLGRWCPNSRVPKVVRRIDPPITMTYAIKELFGLTNEASDYVYLSDGGHFENLGLYELVRRQCRTIVVCDVGADPKYAFNDLGNAIRKCYVDFGARITIDLRELQPDPNSPRPNVKKPYAIGRIAYRREDDGKPSWTGHLIVIKPCLTDDSSADLVNYRQLEKEFPQVSTADQWFAEDQFESYRKLGRECAERMLEDAEARKIPGLQPERGKR